MHRYSTEPTWSIPHFEKMLYDNAQLICRTIRRASPHDGYNAGPNAEAVAGDDRLHGLPLARQRARYIS
jgi:hypothetical protein